MGAAVAVPAALGAIGLIQNEKARSDARNAQNSALSAQERQLALEQQKYDDLQAVNKKLWGMVESFDQAGGFDPEYYVRKAQDDSAYYEGKDLGNLAGALRVLGYKPGDSAISNQLQGVKLNYRRNLDQMAAGIRQNSIFNKLNAYNSTLGSTPNLGGVSNALQNIAQTNLGLSQMYRNQIGNPAGLLTSILPFINQLNAQKNQGLTGGSDSSTDTGGTVWWK